MEESIRSSIKGIEPKIDILIKFLDKKQDFLILLLDPRFFWNSLFISKKI